MIHCSAGEITAGQPRIWRYDRVYPLIDGMLRDVEAIRLASMTEVKPNDTNNVAITILQTLARVSASYDQSIGANNASVRQKQDRSDQDFAQKRSEELVAQADWDTQHKAFVDDRTALENNLRSSQSTRASLMEVYLKSVGTANEENANKAYTAAKERTDDLSKQLAEKNAQISSAGTRPPITPYAAGNGSLQTGDASGVLGTTGLNSGTLSSGLSALPQALKDKLLTAATNTPTLPATKQIDNQITVLYERMARELSVLNDDASREGKKVYLMGFDVGLNPTKTEKNKIAQVTYTLTGGGKCANPYVTQIYPAVSAYNVATFKAETHAWVLAGVFKSLIGLGVSADYQRLKEQVNSGLNQSVYTSGFGSGTNTFGWRFAPAPGDPLVTPGERNVFAFVVVGKDCTPKDESEEVKNGVPDKLTLKIGRAWQGRSGGDSRTAGNANGWGEMTAKEGQTLTFQGNIFLPPDRREIKVERIAYDPIIYAGESAPPFGTVAVELKADIEPDMIVTVGGRALSRVRDWRGRATKPSLDEYFSNSNVEGFGTVSLLRGLLETDTLRADSWMAVNSRTLVINVKTDPLSRQFPFIELHSGSASRNINDVTDVSVVRVGENEFHPEMKDCQGTQLRNIFLPLSSKATPSRKVVVSRWRRECERTFFCDASNKNVVRLQMITLEKEKENPVEVPPDSRVLMIDRSNSMNRPVTAWPLYCYSNDKDLLCNLPELSLLTKGGRNPETRYAFRLSSPGLVDTTVDLDLTKPVAPYFSEQAVRMEVDHWEIKLTRQNWEKSPALEIVGLQGKKTGQDKAAPITIPGDTNVATFEISYKDIKDLRDSYALQEVPAKTELNGKRAFVGTLTGLRTALLPQVQDIERVDQTIYVHGYQFSPVRGVSVGASPVANFNRINDQLFTFDMPAISGPLSLKVGGEKKEELEVINMAFHDSSQIFRIGKKAGAGQPAFELITSSEPTSQSAQDGTKVPQPGGSASEKVVASATVSVDGKVIAESRLNRDNVPSRPATVPTVAVAAPPAATSLPNQVPATAGAVVSPGMEQLSSPSTKALRPSGVVNGIQKYATPIQNQPPANQ